jgi:hypothetical protein
MKACMVAVLKPLLCKVNPNIFLNLDYKILHHQEPECPLFHFLEFVRITFVVNIVNYNFLCFVRYVQQMQLRGKYVCLFICFEILPEQELWFVLQQRRRRSAERRASGSGVTSTSAVAQEEISGFRWRLKMINNF